MLIKHSALPRASLVSQLCASCFISRSISVCVQNCRYKVCVLFWYTYSKTANEICITRVFGDIPIIKLIYKHDWLEFYVTQSVARDVARWSKMASTMFCSSILVYKYILTVFMIYFNASWRGKFKLGLNVAKRCWNYYSSDWSAICVNL